MILRLMERSKSLKVSIADMHRAHAARVRHEEHPASHTDFGGRVLSDCSADAIACEIVRFHCHSGYLKPVS